MSTREIKKENIFITPKSALESPSHSRQQEPEIFFLLLQSPAIVIAKSLPYC